MLKIEKMEIHGFKSFPARTEVSFDTGVTAIVGPNGCGKSNILDALNWVLGEQSVKSLRGSSMQDVIFSGTQRLKPLSRAEVAVTISGEEGDLPDGKRKKSVTRRLYRSGESEYLIDGRPCRLRDIQDLLYGTGMGVKAYSIIEQGRIRAILTGKPHERRALLEEAAGITKFRARRRQAELKLDAAQANLLRVQDIIREVESRMTSLKRQASRARRYQVIRGELMAALATLYVREHSELSSERQRVLDQLGKEAAGRRDCADRVADAERALGTLREQTSGLERGLVDAREELHVVGGEADRLEQSIAYDGERSAACDARMESLAVEAEGVDERLSVLEARHHEARERLAARQDELAQVESQLEEGRQDRQSREQELGDLEAELEGCREEQLRFASRAAETGKALEGLDGLLERHGTRRSGLAVERERQGDLSTAAAERLQQTEDALARATETGERAREARSNAEAALRGAKVADEQARVERAEAAARLGQLRERLRTLDELLARGRDVGASAERAITFLQEQDGFEARGVLADHLAVEERLERATEAALETALGAILVDRAELASGCIDHLGGETAGRATFLVVGTDVHEPPGQRRQPPSRPGVVGWLSELVTAGPEVARAVKGLIGGFLVVEDLEAALALQRECTSLELVTLQGELVQPGGLVRGGVVSGDGLLALRREQRELTEAVAVAEAGLAAAGRRTEEAAAGLAGCEEAQQHAVTELHEAERALVAAEHQTTAARRETSELSQRLQGLSLEIEALEADMSRLEVERAEKRSELEAAMADRRAAEGRIRELVEAISAGRGALATAVARLAEVEAKRAAAQESLKAGQGELEAVRQALADQQGLRERLIHQIAANDAQRRELGDVVAQSQQRLAELRARREELAEGVRTGSERIEEQRAILARRESELGELRQAATTQVERVQRLEIELTRLEGDARRIDERCREDLGRGPEEVLEEALAGAAREAAANREGDGELAADEADVEPPGHAGSRGDEDPSGRRLVLDLDAIEAADMEALRTRVDELRRKLDRLGPVNVLAIDEFEELNERYGFLSAQAEDLTAAIESLNQTITRINRTSRERFRAAYEEVSTNFVRVFTHLFGGGRAELKLTDSDDPLEAGLEISAQPPGKRLQSITLLSGGEKALTALSLLLGLFMYKPSPFCILDEVDAPLDESNIGRFVSLVRELQQGTQFVLITHSPTTMRAADVLYGVTMEEPGASTLVSVRFEERAAVS